MFSSSLSVAKDAVQHSRTAHRDAEMDDDQRVQCLCMVSVLLELLKLIHLDTWAAGDAEHIVRWIYLSRANIHVLHIHVCTYTSARTNELPYLNSSPSYLV